MPATAKKTSKRSTNTSVLIGSGQSRKRFGSFIRYKWFMISFVTLFGGIGAYLLISSFANEASVSKVLYTYDGKGFGDDTRGLGITDGQGGGYTKLASTPTGYTDLMATWSPDGKSYAYFRRPANTEQVDPILFVANSDGTNARQLNLKNYHITYYTGQASVIWSADSKQLLVRALPEGTSDGSDDSQKISWLWLSVDGSGQSLVTQQPVLGRPFGVLDGRIYYSSNITIVTDEEPEGKSMLCSVDSQTGEDQKCFGKVNDLRNGAISGDGSTIATIDSTAKKLQLTEINANDTTEVSLAPIGSGTINIASLAWMPASKKVVFSPLVNGKAYWYSYDTATKQFNKLNIDANRVGGLSWWGNSSMKIKEGSYFNPLTPARLADTRPNSGQPYAGKTLGGGKNLTIQVAGVGGVPTQDVSAVVLNVTEATATANGYLLAYPTGETMPNPASTLNMTPGKIVNNQTTVGLGNGGQVNIYSSGGDTNVVVDVVGYYAKSGNSFTATAPTRVIDTRSPAKTIAPNGSLNVQVAGTNGIPANATSIVANVTEVSATSAGYLALYPAGTALPISSSMNYYNQTLTKEVTVKLGSNPSGALTVANRGGSKADVIIDVVGYYTADAAGMAFMPTSPKRIMDTRKNSGQPRAGQPLTGSGFDQVAQVGMIPIKDLTKYYAAPGAGALVTNVTVPSSTSSNTYLTAFPMNVFPPVAGTSLTYTGGIGFNESTVRLSDGAHGGFKLFNHNGTTDAIVDAIGYYY